MDDDDNVDGVNHDRAKQFLKEHDIKLRGMSDVPLPILNFEKGIMPDNILSKVQSQFSEPTPIQAQAGLDIQILMFLLIAFCSNPKKNYSLLSLSLFLL